MYWDLLLAIIFMNNLEFTIALIFLTSLMLYIQLIPLFITSLVREGNISNRFVI